MNEKLKILVVDDEKKILLVIKSYLEKSGFDVSEAYNGKQALAQFERINPSLIILDLMLPDMSGEEICVSIRRNSKVPIIMLTAKVNEENIIQGLDMGADDYIIKPFSPKQLVARVNALLRRTIREKEWHTNIISFNNQDLLINTLNYEVYKNGKLINLTPNEYKILIKMLNCPKQVFTRDQLIESVFGDEYDGYDRTIDAHIKNLRQKIESDSKKPIYVLTVHGIGYKFGGEKNEA